MTKKIVIDSFEKAVQKLGENNPMVDALVQAISNQ